MVRTRATDSQDPPAKVRTHNVKGAFTVLPGFAAQCVAIVDDEMTTGHTVNALAATLGRGGVRDVCIRVCTRVEVFGR